MYLSVFDMFKVGIGPSSSHTMGPMVAAARFLDMMRASPFHFGGVRASLHGSLAFTGVGHATDRATILGLAGFVPETYDHGKANAALTALQNDRMLKPDGLPPLRFDPKSDLIFDYETALPGHANGMILMATDAQGDMNLQQVFYSIGGGFVMTQEELAAGNNTAEGAPVPYPFKSAAEMLAMARTSGKTIAQMKRANELSRGEHDRLKSGTERLWQVMSDCIDRGLKTEGTLPGGLGVKRRAKAIYDKLMQERGMNLTAPHTINDWMSVYAMAVNEENAAGGQVVTAPTNLEERASPDDVSAYSTALQNNPLPTPNLDGLPKTSYEEDVGLLFDRPENPRTRRWSRFGPRRCRWFRGKKDEKGWMKMFKKLHKQ